MRKLSPPLVEALIGSDCGAGLCWGQEASCGLQLSQNIYSPALPLSEGTWLSATAAQPSPTPRFSSHVHTANGFALQYLSQRAKQTGWIVKGGQKIIMFLRNVGFSLFRKGGGEGVLDEACHGAGVEDGLGVLVWEVLGGVGGAASVFLCRSQPSAGNPQSLTLCPFRHGNTEDISALLSPRTQRH